MRVLHLASGPVFVLIQGAGEKKSNARADAEAVGSGVRKLSLPAQCECEQAAKFDKRCSSRTLTNYAGGGVAYLLHTLW